MNLGHAKQTLSATGFSIFEGTRIARGCLYCTPTCSIPLLFVRYCNCRIAVLVAIIEQSEGDILQYVQSVIFAARYCCTYCTYCTAPTFARIAMLGINVG